MVPTFVWSNTGFVLLVDGNIKDLESSSVEVPIKKHESKLIYIICREKIHIHSIDATLSPSKIGERVILGYNMHIQTFSSLQRFSLFTTYVCCEVLSVLNTTYTHVRHTKFTQLLPYFGGCIIANILSSFAMYLLHSTCTNCIVSVFLKVFTNLYIYIIYYITII